MARKRLYRNSLQHGYMSDSVKTFYKQEFDIFLLIRGNVSRFSKEMIYLRNKATLFDRAIKGIEYAFCVHLFFSCVYSSHESHLCTLYVVFEAAVTMPFDVQGTQMSDSLEEFDLAKEGMKGSEFL